LARHVTVEIVDACGALLARNGTLQASSEVVMSDSNKCPMGKHPWLATFLVIAFLLIFAAKKLGLF